MKKTQHIFNEWGSKNFTTVSNTLICNPHLSARAKGVLIYLLSRPADWDVYASEIERHFTDGIKSIYSILSELEEKGYIERDQSREESGRFSKNEWKVYSSLEYKKALQTNTSTVNPETVNREAVNREEHTTNTNSTNTDSTNNILHILGGKPPLKERKEYGNKDIILLKKVLKDKYPKDLAGISDSRKLWALLTVLKKSKQYEWMDDDWRKNASSFLKEYLNSTEPKYLVGSVYKLKDRVKDWRERGGPKEQSQWVETG